MRLGILIFSLATFMVASFFALEWMVGGASAGGGLDERVGSPEALERFRSLGLSGAALLVGALVLDVVLPVPTTPVLTALGALYGVLLGGALGAIGSITAGLTGFALARWTAPSLARRLLGDRDLGRLERFFTAYGGLAVALSRWLPMVPEMLAVLAGLSTMTVRRFTIALLAGSLPMAFAFAALGAGLADRPIFATLIAALVPALAWPAVRRLARSSEAGPPAPPHQGAS